MAKTSKEKRDQYRTWDQMPFSAMNKFDAIAREERIKAMKKMTENLAPNAFADNVVDEDYGVYYHKPTVVLTGVGNYEEGEDT